MTSASVARYKGRATWHSRFSFLIGSDGSPGRYYLALLFLCGIQQRPHLRLVLRIPFAQRNHVYGVTAQPASAASLD